VRNGRFAPDTLVERRKGFATMCKKLGVTALVIVAGLFVLHKLDLLGYGNLAWHKLQKATKSSISPEVKIERLRAEIDKMTPDLKKHRSAIASEMVDIAKIKDHLGESKANLAKKEGLLKDLRAELDKGSAFVSIGSGEKLPREKVEASLARQWDTYKTARDSVKSQEELLKAREEALDIAKEKLAKMQETQKEMQTKVEKMELELRKVRLAQQQNNIVVDDSQLATVLSLADEIETQIQKEKTELALQKAADTDAAVQEALDRKAKTETALKEMDEFFGADKKVTKKDQ
jgi:chromosome segregation ATPase